MKFGLSTLLYGGFDLDTALQRIKAAGYDGIELCSIPGMGMHVEPGQPDSYYAEVKAKIADAGLEIESIGASGDILGKEGRERFKRMMHAAALLGAPYITTGSGGKADDEVSGKLVLEAIHDLTETCKTTGVKMSIKAHVNSYIRHTESVLKVVPQIDTEWIGINWDCTHVYREGDDPLASFEALKPYIFTVRFRDTLPEGKAIGPIQNQVPGKGVLDVDRIFAALKAWDGGEWITVEMVGAKGLPLDEIQQIVEDTIAWMKSH
ncbi:MAG: sugar phosphate isomerase/epimerase family protein [Candidatus Zipacnadales bacterium]